MFINPVGFDKQHHIQVIKVTVYTVNSDKTQNILKEFLSQIVNEEEEKNLEKTLSPNNVMPLSYYKHDMSFLLNTRQFQNEYNEEQQKELFSSLPEEQIVKTRGTIHDTIGCPHYVCGCDQQCSECGNFYGCKFCHNENEDHVMAKQNLKIIRCKKCSHQQAFGITCEKCKLDFCKYYCLKCKFMCYIGTDEKPFFHCDKCEICRIGDKNDWIHCDTCKRCVHKSIKHICIPDQQECPICLDSLADNHLATLEMACGHLIHSSCFDKQMQQCIYICPLCQKYAISQETSEMLRSEIITQIYQYTLHKNNVVTILCRQCQHTYEDFQSTSQYYQCYKCAGFNTVIKSNDGTIQGALNSRQIGQKNDKIYFTKEFTKQNFIEICKLKFEGFTEEDGAQIMTMNTNKILYLINVIFQVSTIEDFRKVIY